MINRTTHFDLEDIKKHRGGPHGRDGNVAAVYVCLIAPRRIGLGLRAEPPLGPSIQQHNNRRAFPAVAAPTDSLQ
jgi:hypothetical protein